MYDIAYLRKLAERYRKLARGFHHAAIRDRLNELADELEQRIRELQGSGVPAPTVRRYSTIN